MEIDIKQLMDDITTAVSEILNKDVTTIRGFSGRQLNGIANQTALIASGIDSGLITDATRDFFLDQLVELAHNFANTLIGLMVATIEKLWNAIVSVIWSAITKATGITLKSFSPL